MAVKIVTGVDRLVKLVEKERKIDITDAAKQLGVPVELVQEWADFLEQEGLLDTEYTLTKSYLLIKRMSKEEISEKSKEYEVKKDAFTRKVEMALEQLDEESKNIGRIREQYALIKSRIGDDFDAVSKQLEELRHYEDLKKTIDHDIIKQKQEYEEAINRIQEQLSAEERRYKAILDGISGEQQQISSESERIAALEQEEHDMLERIKALESTIRQVMKEIATESDSVEVHKEHLKKLRKLAEQVQQELAEKKKKELDPMVRISDDQAKRILRLQEEIINTIQERRKQAEQYGEESAALREQLSGFFGQRSEVESTFAKLEQMRLEMHAELEDLIAKAKAFDVALRKGDTDGYVQDLERQFEAFDAKKRQFAKEMDNLKAQLAPPPTARA